jgi:hypothetical protein
VNDRVGRQRRWPIAKAIKVEELEGPQKEVDRQKKEADELALERLKNLQSFRP